MPLPHRRRLRARDDWKPVGASEEELERQKLKSERNMDAYDEQPKHVRVCIAAAGSIKEGMRLARAGVNSFHAADEALRNPEILKEFTPNPLLLNHDKPPLGETRLTRKSRSRYA